MKRTVKAWAVLNDTGTPCAGSAYGERRMAIYGSRREGRAFGGPCMRCTITYNDGRPARARARGKGGK